MKPLVVLLLLLAALASTYGRVGQRRTVAGGLTPVDFENDSNRDHIEELTNFAMAQINARTNSLYGHSVIRIRRVYSQIVAGVMYHITFYSGQSTCRNLGVSTEVFVSALLDLAPEFFQDPQQRQTPTLERCPLSASENARFQLCTAKVFEQPWLNNTELSDFKCSPVSRETALTPDV